MTVNMQKPIVIFRGDNTAAFDLRTIKILLTGDLDLTNATARFDLLDFTKSWTTEEVATGELSIVFDSAQTKSFALGPQVGTLRLYDMSTGTPRQLTIINKIPFFITNRVCELDNQSYDAEVCVASGEVIHVEFNVGVGAVEGKADKVKNATAGDLAGLNAEGNLSDSGIPASDVLRKSQMDSTPTDGSQNPVTSDGIKQAIDAATPEDYAQVKAQVETNTGAIQAINTKIPAQASAQNQLADKDFVNSSIATNTATFRGTYNLVSDLSLTTSATHEQVAAAIANKLASLSITPENNDYCFVQVPRETSNPTVIDRIDRYKCTVTESGGVTTRVWDYEWSLNNSSFTAAQWAAINSGITSALVTKLGALPTADELAQALLAKYEKPSGGIPKTDLANAVQTSLGKADSALQGVKKDGATLTPDANKVVDIPDETKVLEYALPASCFPITYTKDSATVTIASNAGLKFTRFGDDVSASNAATDDALCFFDSNLTYVDGDISLRFNGVAPVHGTSPTLEHKETVYVRDVEVAKQSDIPTTASDVGAVPTAGGTMTGNLDVPSIDTQRVELYDDGLDVVGLTGAGLMNPNDWTKVVAWPALGNSDTLALVSQIYAAVQQIAPAWVSGTSYAANKCVSYQGVVYQNTSGSTISSTTTPDTSGSGWTAKKVSELFLPITGGTMSGTMIFNGGSGIGIKSGLLWFGESPVSADLAFVVSGANHTPMILVKNYVVYFPSAVGTLALLQNLAPDYDATSTYALDKLCVHGGKLFRCTTAIETAEAWTAAHWTEATVQDILAALRTSIAAKANLTDLPYAIAAVPLGDALADRTVNTKTVNAATYAPSFPTETSGKSCDFYLAVTSDTAGTVSAPSGKTLVNAKGESANLDYEANKTTVLRFTQIGANTYVVTGGANGGGGTPLSGHTYDFSTNADVYKAVADIARALGATVTNAPTDPVSTPSND